LQELERMDTQLSKVAKGEKTRLFKSMVGNLKHLTGMARSMNFVNNPAIEAIADKIETHLLQHEVDAYKDNAVLARGAAQNARNIHTDVKNNEVWTVGIDGGGQVTPSTTPIGGEATFVVNEQTESDMDFLASLAEDIPTDVVEDPEDEENEPEENEKPNPIGEPEFDEDEFLFSN
jgi:hypothetical protein